MTIDNNAQSTNAEMSTNEIIEQDTVDQIQREAYNLAVGHCLEMVGEWWKERLPNITYLKTRIESLKK